MSLLINETNQIGQVRTVPSMEFFLSHLGNPLIHMFIERLSHVLVQLVPKLRMGLANQQFNWSLIQAHVICAEYILLTKLIDDK